MYSYKETMLKNKKKFLKKCLVFLLGRKLFRPLSYKKTCCTEHLQNVHKYELNDNKLIIIAKRENGERIPSSDMKMKIATEMKIY